MRSTGRRFRMRISKTVLGSFRRVKNCLHMNFSWHLLIHCCWLFARLFPCCICLIRCKQFYYKSLIAQMSLTNRWHALKLKSGDVDLIEPKLRLLNWDLKDLYLRLLRNDFIFKFLTFLCIYFPILNSISIFIRLLFPLKCQWIDWSFLPFADQRILIKKSKILKILNESTH